MDVQAITQTKLAQVASKLTTASSGAHLMMKEINSDGELRLAVEKVVTSLSQRSREPSFDQVALEVAGQSASDSESDASAESAELTWYGERKGNDDYSSTPFATTKDAKGFCTVVGITNELFEDATTGAWADEIIRQTLSYWSQLEMDPWLHTYIQAMRYLRTFFPTEKPKDDIKNISLPFTVKVVYSRSEFRAQCLLSQSWPAAYKKHDAWSTDWDYGHVVVVRGTR